MYSLATMSVDDDQEVRSMVRAQGSGWLVTALDGIPEATLLPVLWENDRVVAHMARANPHWRALTGGAAALLIVGGPEAYISPAWYASKAEHGKVVPTWNYTAVHLHGTVRTIDDEAWVRRLVTRLTDHHEQDRPNPWAVDDAPEEFLDAQLRAIVGIELVVERVQAKAKLSQNRSEGDQRGVVAGLAGAASPGATRIADAMTRRLDGLAG